MLSPLKSKPKGECADGLQERGRELQELPKARTLAGARGSK
jgi:hypothetical protein